MLWSALGTGVSNCVGVLLLSQWGGQPRVPKVVAKMGEGQTETLALELPSDDVADFLLGHIVQMFKAEECYVHQVTPRAPIYQIRKDDMTMTVKQEGKCVHLSFSAADREFARLIFLEALATLIRMFEGLREMDGGGALRQRILCLEHAKKKRR